MNYSSVRGISLGVMVCLGGMIGAPQTIRAQGMPSFSVKVTGAGPAMLLIPGLASPGSTWDTTVEHFKARYTCYVVTLAGFAGQAPIEGPFLPRVRDDLIAYLRRKQLSHVVVVGHSLGGTLAFWVAARAPELFSKVIDVDGFPFFGALYTPTATVESSRPQAEQMRSSFEKQTQAEFAAGEREILKTMITAPADIDRIFESSSKSDPKTVGTAMYELWTTDLRPDLAKIKVPVLAIHTWIGYKQYGATHESVEAMAKPQYANLKNVTLRISDGARHFVMLDDPSWFFAQLDAFLSSKS